KIAKELAGSITLGVGQFCTNPGMVLAIDNDATKKFAEALATEIAATTPATMLNKNICKAYSDGVLSRQHVSEVHVLGKASQEASADKNEAQPVVHTASAESFLASKELSEEIFGP